MRMLLVILLSLLSTSSVFGQNTEDVLDDEVPVDDLYNSDVLLSNSTAEGNFQTEKEFDQESTPSPTTQDVSEAKEGDANEDLEDTDDACGNPPAVSHALIEDERRTRYEVGTELKYSCEFGYSTDGANHVSRCVREDDKFTWTDPGINCIPRSCGDPGFVLNAQRIGSRFTFPNQVSFECDDGYEVKGGNIRYCQVNGKWSGSLPSCEKIFCDQPFHPENGRVSYTSLEYGSQLKYECEKGFLLKNHQTRVCSENGTWSGPEPLCLEAQCDKPDAPEHGSVEVVGGNPRVGSIAIFKCENGRTLVGSGTSKCLEIGEWTFPAPKCVEPCIVPSVEHGTIGRYETKRRSRQRIFTQLPEGTSLRDGEELYLRCDGHYEPLGTDKHEEKISCEKGFWLETPTCVPAKCRSDPPAVQNTRGVKVNMDHGKYVVYYCAQHFKKKPGNVTCHFGTWKGIPPSCSDRRCYVDGIQFPGISKKGKKNMFRNGEVFKFECEMGYDVGGSDNKLVCEEGTWKGHLPPCKAASCSASPPSLQNGRIEPYTGLHSSLVNYVCDEHYFLQQSRDGVQCLFGEWRGTPPACKEGRCYFQNLKHKSGMVAPSKDPTDNGEAAEVKCASGYSAHNIKPSCANGQWTEYGTSPCTPNNCLVDPIDNGFFTQRFSRRVWNWSSARFVNEYYFKEAKLWTAVSPGEELFVHCRNPYTVQGKTDSVVSVLCSEGRWKPTPVCLPRGTYYEERNEMPATRLLAARTANQPKASSTMNYPERQPPPAESISPAIESHDSLRTKECYCLYQGSDDLVAYSGHKLLEAGSRVEENKSVKFYCRHFGYHRFMGQREIVCKTCKPWHSSEYPSCVVPVRGDVIIQIDENQNILPGGILTIEQGVNAQITCTSTGISEYPIWKSTVAIDLSDTYVDHDQSSGRDVHYNVLTIRNANLRHNGYYRCSVAGKREREIQICIHTKCKKFDESDEFNIYYDKGQEVNGSAVFTCKDSNRKKEGPNLLTCLSNGQWSGQPPRCVPKGCPPLPETNAMLITYSHELGIGSTATFHCFSPGVRKGDSFIKCLPNGEWSNTAPSCTMPRCPLEKLYDHIPEKVVPRMEDVANETVPLGFELRLTCEGDLRLTEAAATARCEKNGTWEVPKVSCVPGCAPIQIPPGSNLIVLPERDSYRFGQFVSLECVPGHVLSAEVEVVMCLSDGWSETALPECVEPPSLAGVV